MSDIKDYSFEGDGAKYDNPEYMIRFRRVKYYEDRLDKCRTRVEQLKKSVWDISNTHDIYTNPETVRNLKDEIRYITHELIPQCKSYLKDAKEELKNCESLINLIRLELMNN